MGCKKQQRDTNHMINKLRNAHCVIQKCHKGASKLCKWYLLLHFVDTIGCNLRERMHCAFVLASRHQQEVDIVLLHQFVHIGDPVAAVQSNAGFTCVLRDTSEQHGRGRC